MVGWLGIKDANLTQLICSIDDLLIVISWVGTLFCLRDDTATDFASWEPVATQQPPSSVSIYATQKTVAY